jgi:pyruvate formate lyase activating enzyme
MQSRQETAAGKNVIDYELLPYHRFGLGKYEYLGKVYELDDYQTPSNELVKHLQAIIDEAFGRGKPDGRETMK